MKKLTSFLILIISLNLFSQEDISIKGKLFFSDDFYRTFTNILVKIDSSPEYIQIKEDGNFEIKTPIKKEFYRLFFYYGNIKFKEFDYKFEWTKRKRPKSISLAKNCVQNKSIAQQDFKNKKLKLYLFNPIEVINFSEKDNEVQRKALIKYVQIKKNDILNFDCYLDYNKRVFFIFRLTEKNKFLKILREDVIGFKNRYD